MIPASQAVLSVAAERPAAVRYRLISSSHGVPVNAPTEETLADSFSGLAPPGDAASTSDTNDAIKRSKAIGTIRTLRPKSRFIELPSAVQGRHTIVPSSSVSSRLLVGNVTGWPDRSGGEGTRTFPARLTSPLLAPTGLPEMMGTRPPRK